mmetsp:Transcript_4737/g.12414  ORF Transcript_4737/g.12414 Transcript_4737/m.12414 type:complete len:249 (+) Transcript_4737:1365-2111(+)
MMARVVVMVIGGLRSLLVRCRCVVVGHFFLLCSLGLLFLGLFLFVSRSVFSHVRGSTWCDEEDDSDRHAHGGIGDVLRLREDVGPALDGDSIEFQILAEDPQEGLESEEDGDCDLLVRPRSEVSVLGLEDFRIDAGCHIQTAKVGEGQVAPDDEQHDEGDGESKAEPDGEGHFGRIGEDGGQLLLEDEVRWGADERCHATDVGGVGDAQHDGSRETTTFAGVGSCAGFFEGLADGQGVGHHHETCGGV